jgi:uncharacterized repeat protein (TIGR03806 family)
MRPIILCVFGSIVAVIFLAVRFSCAEALDQDRPYGIERRTPWTTSRVVGTPDPPSPYRTEAAFPKLKFNEPLEMAAAPGTNRLFVAERFGKVYSFLNGGGGEQQDLFLDLGKVIYGITFHPQFAKNRHVYVTYIVHPTEPQKNGTRVSRFDVSRDDPPRCDPASEKVLVEWLSGGHNGGCLMFGPDGCLYIATGDASGIADEYETGQDLSTLAGKILRIDVDHPDAERPYGIPKDNPFVATEGARPEIWAYGLRQPWKISFDRRNSDLWTGNVGQDLWEQVTRIERGGNYGWSVTEGTHPFRPDRRRGPTPILPPVVEHNHADFRSVTGGFVYRGSRLKELVGAYIYGDYDTGRIWMLRYDGKKVTEHRELVDSALRLVGFAEDEAGELYMVDHMGGGIHRLAPNPAASAMRGAFPKKLSQTGLFASVKDHKPAAGLIPYSVVAPAWSDGAIKEFYLALPGESQIEFEAIEFPQPAPGAPRGWKFPSGAVLVETISIEMETGRPASRRRLETRILHDERLTGTEEVGDQYWQGYTYVWNDEQTDAVLLEDREGRDRTFAIRDAAAGGQRQFTWHYPSRAECTVCHNMAAKYALGATTLQMNNDHDYGGVVDNQLRTLEHIGVFAKPLPERPDKLPSLVDYRDDSHSLDDRARSYLHANCSYCHRKWGGGNAEFQLLATLKLNETGAVDTRPGQGGFFIPDAKVIAPGDPYRSIVFYRMAKLGPGRMPRMGSNVVDEVGVRLMHDWLSSLSTGVAARKDSAAAIESLRRGDQSAKERDATIDALLASTAGALRLMHATGDGKLPAAVHKEVIGRGSQHKDSHVRDLFERYIPEEQRTKRLGSVVKPQEILALPGDAARGRRVFFDVAGVQCKNCHKIQGQGTDVGPELSEIGKKYDRARLLETILEPSREIDPKYVTYLMSTKAGLIHSGLLVKKDADEVVLKDAQNKLIRVPADDVENLVPQQQSLMPELLLRDMTARDVADLIAFLAGLK